MLSDHNISLGNSDTDQPVNVYSLIGALVATAPFNYTCIFSILCIDV